MCRDRLQVFYVKQDGDKKDLSSISKALCVLFRKSISRSGGKWLRVVSHSMYPIIGTGDWIWIESIRDGKFRVGDIVLFIREAKLITHRILKVDRKNEVLVEKGDDSGESNIVPYSDVVGRITQIKKPNRIINVEFGRGKWINRYQTLISFLHSYWHERMFILKSQIPLRLRRLLRKMLLFKYIRDAREYRMERVRVGNRELHVRVPPGIEEMNEAFRSEQSLSDGDGVLFIFGEEQCVSIPYLGLKRSFTFASINKDRKIIEIFDTPSDKDSSHITKPCVFLLKTKNGWFTQNNVKQGSSLLWKASRQ